ncbi:GDSL-type esterase/lipase family protein [Actinomadura sp. DC4]|uniref:GDSL-type esterase/lipase family protein n=1 Tax=Actinomadura sp. DC4 TaxID=3055069 RepID=UPI0025B1AF02|nr:GDSL-type esterase/lipase family protein [Actinomadura sp. DC4]MDN3351937.1 SGNH/GDSL hydrolase family protein [Actinomadura sp. DC4]
MTEMRDVPLVGGPVEFRGALDLECRTRGVMPRRLPAWTREQYPDTFMDFVTMMPSGVRLVFRTEADTLELDILTVVRHIDGDPEPHPPGMVDIRVDGKAAGHAEVPVSSVLRLPHVRAEGELVHGLPGTVEFAGLPSHLKEVELWLPQQTPCELVGLRANAPLLRPTPSGRRRWVHYGSSISHCVEADSPTGTWPVIAASRAGVEVVNLGFAGNAMLDPYVARTMRDLPADLISVKTGANIVGWETFKPRTFGPAVHGFLDTVRDGHPDTPLLVISPIILPLAEDVPDVDPDVDPDVAVAPKLPLTMPVVRETLAEIVRLRARHDPHLHFLDGRELFGAGDVADLPDGTHPNAAGYRRIGERFATRVFGPDGAFHADI